MATTHPSKDLIAEARWIAREHEGASWESDAIDALERLADALEAAEAERDAALAVIEKAREPRGKSWQAGHPAYRILSSVPADVLRERDRRVKAEAVREFRVNDLRDRAERADERWKAWGDVNDADLRDRLFQQAAAIEQNSEGNET